VATAALGQDGHRFSVSEPIFRFPDTPAGSVIEHEYVLRNEGIVPLRIRKADMSPPLRPTKLPAMVPPGGEATVRFRLDTAKLAGTYEGLIVLVTDNPAQPEIALKFEGEVVPPIEFRPMAAFYVSAQRGEAKSASIEIHNHREQPLEILQAESPSSRFTLQLETLAEGKRYRLSLTTLPDAPSGKKTEMITLLTSDPERPRLKVQANTLIRERVYAFPEQFDFGTLRPAALKGNLELLSGVSETLMVYRVNGKDFQITARSDIPFLHLHVVRSDAGDRYQITISVIPEKMSPGPVSGSVLISTNDPEFPVLTVPVKAVVTGSW
jgi:hypothetical protein